MFVPEEELNSLEEAFKELIQDSAVPNHFLPFDKFLSRYFFKFFLQNFAYLLTIMISTWFLSRV